MATKKVSPTKKQVSKPITLKKTLYNAGLMKGMTKYDAAIAAGYSPTTARVAAANIETVETRNALRVALEKKIKVTKLVTRISEGLDAKKTEFAKFEGEISDSVECVDFEQRRKYVELAAELMGFTDRKGEVVNNNFEGPAMIHFDL